MNKHTPGPWKVREYYSDIVIKADGFREPALVRRIIERGDECPTELRIEQVANARLIAAAPTMADYIAKKASAGDAEAAQIMEAIHGNA